MTDRSEFLDISVSSPLTNELMFDHEPVIRAVTDEAAPATTPRPLLRSLDLPGRVHGLMTAFYLSFLVSMALAFGVSDKMGIVLAVCAVYALLFFMVPVMFTRVPGVDGTRVGWRRMKRSGMGTHFGPMNSHAVLGQVLVVPICVALFGLAVIIIKSATF